MASLDALRHVTIGEYLPGDTVIHRLDPRAKIVGFLLVIVGVVVADNYAGNLVLVAAMCVALLMARLRLRTVLANVVPALPLIALFVLLQLLFYGRGPTGLDEAPHVLIAWGPIVISAAGVRLVIVSLLRFLSLIIATALLTNTSTVDSLTRGVESLLRPLDMVGLPGHEVAMICAIALRFLPILGEQMQSIARAQELRGLDLAIDSRWQIVRNARRLAALIIPLFIDVYRRSEEMVAAMLARCYRGGRGRSHLVQLTFAPRDLAAILAATGLLVAIVATARAGLP